MTFNGFSDYCRALRRVSQPRERARQRRRSRQTPPLATVERLESRALLSAINGTVFSDRDADGGRDFGESGVADVTVYLDLDGDGALDAGEATAVTNADGFYQFNEVAAGEYVIRTVVPEGFQQSPTIGSFYSIDVTNRRLMKIDGGVVTAIDLIPPAGRTKPAIHGLALTNDDELFALEANLSPYDALWKIDAATGGLTYIGSTGQSHAWGMCYDPATDTIYGVAYIDFRVRLGTIDQQTGVFTAVPTGNGVPSSGGLGALTGTGGIAFDTVNRRIIAYDFHDGELYSFALDGTAVKLSQTNAALSGSLAFDGERFVMERRDDATLIALDPDAGTWSVIAQHDIVFFEEALEFVPGSADYLRVLVQVDQTVTASDIGLVPPTAAIRGTVWDDADADGVRDAGEGTLSGVTVYLDLNANGKYDQGSGTTAALNPAQFPNGSVLTDALPGATLTALSPTGGPFDSVKAYTGYFAHRISYGTEATFWGGSFPVLRIDFADPVDSFTIDARGYSSGPSGWLRAYDVDGNLIATFLSGPLSNTSLSTLKVSAPGIAYVLASGTGTPSPYVLFGKMTASTLTDEPSTTTAADGSYAFDGLEAGTYHVGQIAPAGYYRTTNGNDRDVYYGTAYVPGTNGEMKLVTVDAITGQITWIGDPLPQRIYGLVRTNSGELYGTTFASDSLHAIDPATGRMRLIGNTGWQITGGLAYDPQTDTLYTLGKPTANDTVNRLLVIDRTTGTVTPIGDGIAGLTGTSSLAFNGGSRRIIALDNADGEFYEFRLDGTARYLATGPNVRSYVMSQSDDGFILQPLATGNGFFSEVDPDTAALGSQLALSEPALFESLDWNFDRFRYTVELDGFDVEDINFGHSDTNTAPVVPPQSFTVDEDTTWSGEIAATDAEGQPLTFQVVSGPTHGTLTLTGDGNFLYTPDRNYHGSDTFAVRAFDGLVWSDTATISISVSPVNDLPVAITQAWATDEDATLDGRVYARDLDGDPVTFELVSGPTHGTLRLNADGTFVYTPAANYFGTDSFVFRAFDGQGYSPAVTQSITVRSVNDAPVGIADAYTTVEDTPLTIAAATTLDFTGTMTSDPGDYIGAGGSYSLSDESGQFTVYFGQNRNNVGLYWRNPTNSSDYWRFEFAAAPGEQLAVGTYTGVARYPFNDAGEPGLSVTGQHRGSNTLTGEFTVWKLRWAADGSLEEFEVSFEQHSEGFEPALRGHLHYVAGHENRGVLANDSDVEGDPITAILVSGPTNGSVTLNPDGSFTYTPNANFTGTDSFIYVASDGTASSEPVTVMIEVTPVNDPPFAGDASFLGDEDAALTGKLEGVDVDGDVLMYVLEQLPLHGELTLNADGTFAYQPEANYHGADSFTYHVFDGTTHSTAATVSLDLRPVNDAPTVTGGAFTVRDNATVGTIAGSVSAVDVDGDSLTYAIIAGDLEGYFAIDETGVITVARGGIDYQATPVFSLSVLVSDGHGSSTMAAVTIDVRAITASIDIKPGDSSNSLHNKRDNVFSIAILSSFELDASQIDIGSLTFGATGDEASLVVRKNGSYKYSYRDVNGDGLVDLVVDFELKKAELPSGTSTATLKGRLLDGTDFEAFDEVAVDW